METKVINYNLCDSVPEETTTEQIETLSNQQGERLVREAIETAFDNAFDTADFSAVVYGGLKAICDFIILEKSIDDEDAEFNASYIESSLGDILTNTMVDFSKRTIN